MSLSRSLSRLLLSLLLNDNSQQTLNLIRHFLSNLYDRSKISMKISLLYLVKKSESKISNFDQIRIF